MFAPAILLSELFNAYKQLLIFHVPLPRAIHSSGQNLEDPNFFLPLFFFLNCDI